MAEGTRPIVSQLFRKAKTGFFFRFPLRLVVCKLLKVKDGPLPRPFQGTDASRHADGPLPRPFQGTAVPRHADSKPAGRFSDQRPIVFKHFFRVVTDGEEGWLRGAPGALHLLCEALVGLALLTTQPSEARELLHLQSTPKVQPCCNCV